MELEIIAIMFGTVAMKEMCFWNPRLSPSEIHVSVEPWQKKNVLKLEATMWNSDYAKL